MRPGLSPFNSGNNDLFSYSVFFNAAMLTVKIKPNDNALRCIPSSIDAGIPPHLFLTWFAREMLARTLVL
jgi:hypothetical protein